MILDKATRIEIESTPPMVFNVDGEILPREPALFELLPRALEMVVGEMEREGVVGLDRITNSR